MTTLKYHVFFEDDSADNGGVGLVSFEKEGEALLFIAQRLRSSPKHRATLENYKLICGEILSMDESRKVNEVVVKVT